MPRSGKIQQTEAVNWLAWLDERAPTLPQPQYWGDWDCNHFLLVRYPHLQPISPPDSVLPRHIARQFFETSKRVFYEMLADYEEKIAIHEEANRVLEGLSKEQRQQVAALLIDSISSFEYYEPDAKFSKELGELAREAPHRLRMLKRKIDKARDTLEELRNYSLQLHWTMRGKSREPHWERGDSRWAAERCLKTLEEVELPKAESFKENREDFVRRSPYPNDPATLYMVKFYWLFRHGCGVPSNESQVRVAIIRNAFWTEWATPVQARPSYDSVDSQGCNAVRQAVSRFSLEQGTTL